ncbi:hypothetical protein ACFQ16_07870 [Saccharopolyspora rosea]|uniref:DivIVA domain-containing protein n=1 Tax=Saccharopolyspora rosea TaxID=524884 RepID=A0ABW3FPP2_9PSEU
MSDQTPIDPDYFSLRVRQALSGAVEPEDYLDDALAALAGPGDDEVMAQEFGVLASHPEVVAAGERVVAAEVAVLEAEAAGVTDKLAMRRLERARAEERAVLVRLQKRRALGHTVRSQSRVAQVIALQARFPRRFSMIRGGEAA